MAESSCHSLRSRCRRAATRLCYVPGAAGARTGPSLYGDVMPDERMSIPRLLFSVVRHCNLRCMGCNHFAPFAEPGSMSLDSFRSSLEILARHVRAYRLKLTGGEPLLHPQLVEMLVAAKESSIAPVVQVGTNGVLLDSQPDAFWEAVDSVDLTRYPDIDLNIGALMMKAVRFGTELIVTNGSMREPAATRPRDDHLLTGKIFRVCFFSRFCHTVWEGRLYRCSQAAYLDILLAQCGIQSDFATTDGIEIEDRYDMGRRIAQYLTQEQPLSACAYCMGGVGRRLECRQVDASVALPADVDSPEKLLDRRLLRYLLSVDRARRAARLLPAPVRRLLLPLWGRLRGPIDGRDRETVNRIEP